LIAIESGDFGIRIRIAGLSFIPLNNQIKLGGVPANIQIKSYLQVKGQRSLFFFFFLFSSPRVSLIVLHFSSVSETLLLPLLHLETLFTSPTCFGRPVVIFARQT
jgi:hypothetical protein